jgi:hypothetical protein
MFKFPIDHVRCTIRDTVCPRSVKHNPSGSQPGIVFCLDLDRAYYTDDNQWSVRRMAYVSMCGNTSVFVALAMPQAKPWLSYQNVPLDRWENTSNHDSEWRTDGFASRTTSSTPCTMPAARGTWRG